MTEAERPSEAAMRMAMASAIEGEEVPTVSVIRDRIYIRVGKDYVGIKPKYARHVERELARAVEALMAEPGLVAPAPETGEK